MNIIGNTLCTIRLHKWTPWRKTTKRVVKRDYITKTIVSDVITEVFQERNCERCRMCQMKDCKI